MSDKRKFPRAQAIQVAKEICNQLKDYCERLIVAGSLRRRKQLVGDVEILYIPKFVEGAKNDFFKNPEPVNCVDVRLEYLLDPRSANVLRKRLNVLGSEVWGAKNKLGRHIASEIPVDFFLATEANWFNYLVCRTGPAESNTRIASAAQVKGWKWNPYGVGFTNECGETVPVKQERDAFEFVGLPYLEPWERS